MEAMDNHPDVFKEENQLKGTPSEKLLERANNPYGNDMGATEDDFYLNNPENDHMNENLNT